MLRILRVIAGRHVALDDPLANYLRHIARTVLATAKEDERTSASAALMVRLEHAINAVPEPLKAHLIGRLEKSSWNSSSIRFDVRCTIEWLKAETLEESWGSARGPGTVRKRLLGDAIDYLGGEILALLRTRPDPKLTGDDSGLLAELTTLLWGFANGRGADDIPMLERRAARQIVAERIRAEAAVEFDAEARRLTALEPAIATADEKYAESRRAARGRFPRKSQSAREKD